MAETLSTKIAFNKKQLNLLCVSLNGGELPSWLRDEVAEAFQAVSRYITNGNQTVYIRDIPFLAIEGRYPGGHCYNPYEVMIAVPDWEVDRTQLKTAINHELHHMARWQNAGYGETLGGAILSEGIATYYEELVSGWTPPWAKVAVSNQAKSAAQAAWDSTQYSHTDWFFEGSSGKWIGYGIG